ncbi:hypothetical protein SSCH_110024 [Syntrophaceticus schinkii]|uniref:Uncharacterized protein n=1 Tax=Syntrophaceticus schinkii TaxID=499207 RepID=A0A0B7MIP5_9FIRM|nr:hypothetical protein SSCH_110024 [Syntrophaceticus schinkii]
MRSEMWDVGCGKWEVGSGKWEVGSGKWEVGIEVVNVLNVRGKM